MFRPLTAVALSLVLLAGCGAVRESRFNPFNWFGQGTAQPAEAQEGVNPLIPRRRSVFQSAAEEVYGGRAVAEISELLVERRPGGAILRVTGVADRQGPFDVRLVPVPEETDGNTLTFELQALQQPGRRDVGPAARSVIAALALKDSDLLGIRSIRVKGARNMMTSRR